ncbi:ketoacyl-ACP synthase III [Candidatus Hepatincolaceae symbiont of Richtersius coronifer]
MFSKIISTGSYLPEKILTNADLAQMVETNDDWIYSRTGIKQRHIAAANQHTSDLAYEAIILALKKANLTIEDIDGIIVATSTPDLTFPSTATITQRKLGKARGFAFDIQAVCSGFIYALSVADSMIIAKRANRILVVGAEVFSRIIDWKDRNTCVLFGDGAGAVILENTPDDPKEKNHPGILGVDIFSDGSFVDALKTDSGTAFNQRSGFIVMNGQEVYKNAIEKLATVAEYILARNNLDKSQINWLIPHQANVRIINSLGNKLELAADKIIITINDHANTSAASIPLALDFALKSNKVKQNDLILLAAMGAGFTWGACLLRA